MAHGAQSDTRKKLLELFAEANGEFLSGQKISERLGCSRAAVWKHIEELRKEGFELEAVRRLGYRIVSTPDKVTANEIQLGLKTETLGHTIHFFEEVDSTQRIAAKLAYEGAPEGTLVVAEEQKAGRGRLDRKWFSPKGTGIWMSLILRPPIPPQRAPQLTLLVAVAISQAIQEVTGLVPDIKWPNDILLHGKKGVGILTELQADPDRVHSVIVGIGINVNQTAEQFPEDIRAIATSLAIEKGERIKRAPLIQEILLRIERLYKQYLAHGFRPIKLLWEGYAVSIGKPVTARTLGGTIRGIARGITEDGLLILEDEEQNTHYIHSADIQL
ncbi:biotin--[acetyl-CoA-carboxylase] ligase [Geobacillus sp. WSUCF-018B]|uniref:biotin--[acetyl-CoA-carboxylase] ligase n=1 Tax=Geobacillus TaxID=129337 RepID=UPI00067CC024|nr:biotin--[acetyl-CoA-carboxylase] ligase [Geobacillus sp. WSUCF-018B]AKU25549.1 biotin--acetyl-CoA-carboxylase ligase [Geobacillus sp. LC300]ASS86319.1 bifunctional biotin--[acetyl-CoA-carboxylase] synthetase/biotin operon repressor [Geobacillus lituanicus]ATA60408.1 Biotin operon repressor - Biotin--[acetyl-CoA-carboxylase] synthetase [Geobacillus stearothermophilus]KZE97463.1 Bifunctional ligase/repressor BirA [Geobacillus stearothermophilus]PJW17262.1 bifunctional biotin--[acetyl-CoA-carb